MTTIKDLIKLIGTESDEEILIVDGNNVVEFQGKARSRIWNLLADREVENIEAVSLDALKVWLKEEGEDGSRATDRRPDERAGLHEARKTKVV